jgi:outer membrane protein OmpA-like peptidoglycan-associated protein
MKTAIACLGTLLIGFFTVSDAVFSSSAQSNQDHPLLGRMKDFNIASYEVKDFDRHEFRDSKGNDLSVEGRKYIIQYELREGAQAPTPLQITRNYINAIAKIGGSSFQYTDGTAFLSVKKDGRETWVEVYATDESYTLTIVEKQELVQEVTAGDILSALNKEGRIALYIHFDTGDATIKAESKPVIAEIVRVLRENPVLKMTVEGHTDNVGNAKSNQTLSEKRAASVVSAIVEQGIDNKRLQPAGFGQDKPIAENVTEAGRAKNRRVELVKR